MRSAGPQNPCKMGGGGGKVDEPPEPLIRREGTAVACEDKHDLLLLVLSV